MPPDIARGQAAAHPAPTRTYAAYTNQGFLLREASFVAQQMLLSLDPSEIAQQVLGQDAFQLRSAASRKTILNAVVRRLEGVDEELLGFLTSPQPDLKRLTNLYLILLRHRLLREFVAEVLREELLQFSHTLYRGRLLAFFERKRLQESAVGGWSAQTLAKAQSNIVAVTQDAGLLEPQDGRYLILPQVVPAPLRRSLEAAGRAAYLPLLLDQEAR